MLPMQESSIYIHHKFFFFHHHDHDHHHHHHSHEVAPEVPPAAALCLFSNRPHCMSAPPLLSPQHHHHRQQHCKHFSISALHWFVVTRESIVLENFAVAKLRISCAAGARLEKLRLSCSLVHSTICSTCKVTPFSLLIIFILVIVNVGDVIDAH